MAYRVTAWVSNQGGGSRATCFWSPELSSFGPSWARLLFRTWSTRRRTRRTPTGTRSTCVGQGARGHEGRVAWGDVGHRAAAANQTSRASLERSSSELHPKAHDGSRAFSSRLEGCIRDRNTTGPGKRDEFRSAATIARRWTSESLGNLTSASPFPKATGSRRREPRAFGALDEGWLSGPGARATHT